MSSTRSAPFGWFPVTVAVCVLGAGFLGWLAWEERAAGQKAGAALGGKLAERDRLSAEDPQPSAASEQRVAEELAAVRRTASALASTLDAEATGIFDMPAPTKPVDAYFELAAYVEKNRALAAAARTVLADNERFGFASHATQGPAGELLPFVARQAAALRPLLEGLFASAPRELLAVQRERPLTAEQWTARRAGKVPHPAKDVSEPGASADYFFIDPALSLLVPGETDTMAFRVEFTGHTASLRGFLNSVAASPVPFFVRSVEVEPLAAPPAGSAVDAEAVLPVVEQTLSRFAVVVEFVELVPRHTTP
jgi:hypothetical protein